jgi:hypothetical protein
MPHAGKLLFLHVTGLTYGRIDVRSTQRCQALLACFSSPCDSHIGKMHPAAQARVCGAGCVESVMHTLIQTVWRVRSCSQMMLPLVAAEGLLLLRI